MRAVERVAYVTAGALLLSGVTHLAILVGGGGTWEGPLSLRKPMTFGLSFGLTLVNVTLLASLVPLKERSRTVLLAIFSGACLLETFLVSLQAWRGVPSHFNMETPFDAAIAQLLAIGGATLVAIITLFTVAVFRHGHVLPSPLRVAIQAGFVALIGAQIAGGVMIATGVRLVMSGDVQLAYATGGWLKPVHAALMHGILVLPLAAWLISMTRWSARTQTHAVRLGLSLYLFGVAATIVHSLATG